MQLLLELNVQVHEGREELAFCCQLADALLVEALTWFTVQAALNLIEELKYALLESVDRLFREMVVVLVFE